MPRIRTDQPVLPSILDRLIDDDPENPLHVVKPFGVLLKEIKTNIRRDLENLLNTRMYRQQDITAYAELGQSIVNYGLPDFSRLQFGSQNQRDEFRRLVQSTIRKYEPRFERVDVEINPINEDYERTLYLKISAVLMVEPDPVPLIFDSRVRAVDRAVTLRELKHG
ncbi:MAG: type VI secretion system baseplate subunit TssE [Gammaproteobacteria bacterium]|nr:type VI secretion system baseplate subunit TssE [Gammaproteobacteria bacterium]